jgi:hypothetical protein
VGPKAERQAMNNVQFISLMAVGVTVAIYFNVRIDRTNDKIDTLRLDVLERRIYALETKN